MVMKRMPREAFRLESPEGRADGLEWGLVEVTPDLGDRILLGVPDGDTGSTEYKRIVQALEAEMAAGDFPVTGDTLVIAADGIANDGRARLRAAVRSRTSFWSFLVTGVDPEARFCTDLREAGARPTQAIAGMRLVAGGEDEAMALVRRACSLARQLDLKGPTGSMAAGGPGDIARSFALSKGVRECGGFNRASVAAFHYLASGRDARRADAFVAALLAPDPGRGRPEDVLAGGADAFRGGDGEAALAAMAHAWFCGRSGLPYAASEIGAAAGGVEDTLARLGLARSRDEEPVSVRKASAVRRGRPRLSMETITRAKARRLIARTDLHGMADYADITDDLRGGRWRQTGQTIKVDSQGRLLDGRRRLCAVIESGVAIRVLVARGIDPAAEGKLHRGRKASLGHRLQAEGAANKQPYDIAAAAKNILRHETGDPRLQPTVPAMRAAILAYPSIVEGVRLAKGLKQAFGMRVGIAASCYALMAREDEAEARMFLHLLGRPPLSGDGSAPIVLRATLLTRKPPDTDEGQALTTRWVLDAWRAYHKARKAPPLRAGMESAGGVSRLASVLRLF